MKFSVNSLCPCGSKQKYKKCCQPFHKGKVPTTSLELMKSRYVAFKLNISNYIINTTHPYNKDFSSDLNAWQKDIESFSLSYDFKGLEIIDFTNGDEESFVTFKAIIVCNEEDNSFTERSRFLKVKNRWLYVDGEFL
jgi:SEC-C motif-containing protein